MTLALGLAAFGCDDEEDGGTGGTGGTGGATGGTGGRGGTGGTGGTSTGGTGGSTGGTGGATGGTGGSTGGTGGSTGGTAGDAGVDTSPDTGEAGDTAGGEAGEAGGDTASSMWTAPCSTTPTPASAADFCAQYMTACSFGAAATSFANMGACVTRYNSYAEPGTATTGKMCATYHLCQASQTGNMVVHCPHPAQAAGPCNLPAR